MFATDGDDIGLLEVKEIELDLPSVGLQARTEGGHE
jgi:hypothetical protein